MPGRPGAWDPRRRSAALSRLSFPWSPGVRSILPDANGVTDNQPSSPSTGLLCAYFTCTLAHLLPETPLEKRAYCFSPFPR